MRREFRLSEADEAFLDSLKIPWETVRQGGTRWLLLHDFPVGSGYNVETAAVAIRIEGGYPPGPLDMAWFHPALSRKDGVGIGALSTEQIDERPFQRWSRHYPWREGVDDLSTHVRHVEAWLRDEFMRRR
jgi:hypothetical protein